ncbi:MAG TPA: hypothetical protein VLU91_09445 [Nitrososphaerales archaeon]|nr:hypothetical protein [Nitrososphaerales archaeon]
MERPTKTLVFGIAFLLLLGVAFGVYYQSVAGSLSNQNQSISSLWSQVNSLQNLPPTTVTSTLTAISTLIETTSSVSTTTRSFTTSFTTTVATTSTIPWNSSYYLSVPAGCPNSGGKAECWTLNYSLAIAFDCAAVAATTQGCTETVNGSGPTHPSYNITIWYPYVYVSQPPNPFNCAYSVPVDNIDHNLAYCISLNRASFIISLPGPIVP